MAKKSKIAKAKKIDEMSSKFFVERKELKKKIKDKSLTIKERMQLQFKLNSMHRNTSRVRVITSCFITGKKRGVFRDFMLCRTKFRELALLGHIPGLKKSNR